MKKKLSMLIILFMSLFLISDVKAAAPSWLYTSFVAPYEDYGIKKDGNKVSVPIHFEQRKDVDYKLEYDKAIIKSVSLESDYLDYDKDTNKYIVNKEGKFAGYENDSYKDCYQFNNTVTGNLIIEFNDIKTITSDIKIKILSDKGLIEKAPHNGNYNSSKVNCSNSTIDQFTKNEKEIIISSDLIKNSSTLEVTEETSNVDSNTTLKNITVNNTKVSIKIIKENEQYKMIYPTNHINKSLKYSIIVNNEKVFSYPNIKESYNLENDYTIAGVGASAKEQKYTNQDNIKIVFESFDGSIKKEISINSNKEEVITTTPSEDPKDDDDFIEDKDDDLVEDEDNKNNILYIVLGVSALIILILVIIIITKNAKKKKQNIETNIDEKIN